MFDAAKIDGARQCVFSPLRYTYEAHAFVRPHPHGSWRDENVGQVILMTNGGPGTSSEVLALLMYRQGFEFLNFVGCCDWFILFMLISLSAPYLLNSSVRRRFAMIARQIKLHF